MQAGKDEVPAMMSRACSPMVFLSTDRSPHEAGLALSCKKGTSPFTLNIKHPSIVQPASAFTRACVSSCQLV